MFAATRNSRSIVRTAMALGVIVSCASCSDPVRGDPTYNVFFAEFSAEISPEARMAIDMAATEAKRRHTSVRVVARANATGSADATMKIAETRAAVTRDALLSDGIALSSITLVPLGRAGQTDTSVMPRRVTITLEN